MKIRTDYWKKPVPFRNFDWDAIDADTYDGAPDAGPRSQVIGYGATEQEAIDDLLEKLAEFD